MKCKISILVPIYNVELYLDRCIDSVISQSFEDWEMILVDDGSTDRSPVICNDAACRDSRIKVVHKRNGGLPSARLAGFKEANGEYIIFLDSDDWMLKDGVSLLYDAITSNGGYDVVKSLVRRIDNEGNIHDEHYIFEEGELCGKNCFQKAILEDNISPYVHSAIFRKDVFDEEHFKIVIRNGIGIGEDWFMNVAASARVERALFINQPSHAYFINNTSMMGSSIYGWDYYEKIERCKHELNAYIKITETDEYLSRKALVDLRYFFFPEVGFSWKHFRNIQPLALKGLEYQKKKSSYYNPKYCRFISYAPLYWIYTHLFRMLFFILKLRCRKRKVVR